jgi:hypothetical protein
MSAAAAGRDAAASAIAPIVAKTSFLMPRAPRTDAAPARL